jgi:putative ABC transport system permease protein
VVQRSREIGIRMALGASARDVVARVAGEGLGIAAVGIAIGAVAALALGRLVSSLLYGVGAMEPGTYAIVVLALVVVAGLAAATPAYRAARVDPARVLRDE